MGLSIRQMKLLMAGRVLGGEAHGGERAPRDCRI